MKKGKFLKLIRVTGKGPKKEESIKEITYKTTIPVKEVKKLQVKELVPNELQVEEQVPTEREKIVLETRRKIIEITKGDGSFKTNTIKRKVLYKEIFHEIFADSQKKMLLFFFMSSLTALGFCKTNKSYAFLLLALTIYLLKPTKLLRLYKEYMQSKGKRKKVLEELENLGLSVEMLKKNPAGEEVGPYLKRALQDNKNLVYSI